MRCCRCTRRGAPSPTLPFLPPLPPPAACTHRELFALWYADLMREPLSALLARAPRPAAAERLFDQMLRDIAGTQRSAVDQVRRPGVCVPWLPRGSLLARNSAHQTTKHTHPTAGRLSNSLPLSRPACLLGSRPRPAAPTQRIACPAPPRPDLCRRATPWGTTWPLSTWPTTRRRGCSTPSGLWMRACWRQRGAPSPSGSSWR
jgi:hypothetical protein